MKIIYNIKINKLTQYKLTDIIIVRHKLGRHIILILTDTHHFCDIVS